MPQVEPRTIAHTGFVKYTPAVQQAIPPAIRECSKSRATILPFTITEIPIPTKAAADIEYHIFKGTV